VRLGDVAALDDGFVGIEASIDACLGYIEAVGVSGRGFLGKCECVLRRAEQSATWRLRQSLEGRERPVVICMGASTRSHFRDLGDVEVGEMLWAWRRVDGFLARTSRSQAYAGLTRGNRPFSIAITYSNAIHKTRVVGRTRPAKICLFNKIARQLRARNHVYLTILRARRDT
jgi:hypothetical protein